MAEFLICESKRSHLDSCRSHQHKSILAIIRITNKLRNAGYWN